jgi:hypothetical protein
MMQTLLSGSKFGNFVLRGTNTSIGSFKPDAVAEKAA